jgi:lipoprotein-releasing system ATP-binding protein
MPAQMTTSASTPASGATHPGALIETRDLRKTYGAGAAEITVLSGVNVSVAPGKLIAVVGPSGAGKSTLLHLLAALDTPTSGTVYFANKAIETNDDDAALAEFRNRAVGFLWQRHQLLPDFTAAENVAMPLLLRGEDFTRALGMARKWLAEVGLENRADHRAGELSGGEQQRVAIARALVHAPRFIIADEPTGNLDPATAWEIMQLFLRINARGATVVMATHNREIVDLLRRRVIAIDAGQIARDDRSGRYHDDLSKPQIRAQ